MTGKKKFLMIAGVVALAITLLGVEVLYVTGQMLDKPGTVKLETIVNGGMLPTFDPVNCVLAGEQTGWKGYRNYLGFIFVDEQKLDIVSQDGILTIGSDALKNCQSIIVFLKNGKIFQELTILNRFNQIWYRIEPYE
jgi:hypothetical protein